MDGGSMFVIHANWTDGNLHLWAESLDQFTLLPYTESEATAASANTQNAVISAEQTTTHPYAVSAELLAKWGVFIGHGVVLGR